MLTLYRRIGEKIIIGYGKEEVTIILLEKDEERIKLGFEAPKHIPVDRAEIRHKKLTSKLVGRNS